jgi:hypothetical protein
MLFAALGAGLVLSGRTHFVRMYNYGYSFEIWNLQWAAVVGALAYAVAYGVGWFAKKWGSGTRYAIYGVIFVVLGVLAVRQGPEQLSRVGFAARNRTPDPAAVGLAIGGGVLALWQIINLFWKPLVLSNRVVMSSLVFLNVYLFFAAW